jgi:hypothetical protein
VYFGAVAESLLPYKPIRLLIAYDPSKALCDRVVPRMKSLLEQRAFEVDVQPLSAETAATLDLSPYRGVILGVPVAGLGIKGDEVGETVLKFIEQAEVLEEKKLALFTVFSVSPGRILRKLRDAVEARGCVVVVDHAYNRFSPERDEHILPAECMCRIRGPG